jgi:hypothetical protein
MPQPDIEGYVACFLVGLATGAVGMAIYLVFTLR